MPWPRRFVRQTKDLTTCHRVWCHVISNLQATVTFHHLCCFWSPLGFICPVPQIGAGFDPEALSLIENSCMQGKTIIQHELFISF